MVGKGYFGSRALGAVLLGFNVQWGQDSAGVGIRNWVEVEWSRGQVSGS